MLRNCTIFAVIFVAFTIFSIPVSVFGANTYTEAHQLVDHSKTSLNQFISDPNMLAFRDLAKRARAIIIVPQMLRGGLVLGGTGGSGILIARDMRTGLWKGPAFYSIGSITFGLQIGAEASQVIMVVMTEKGLNSMMSSSFKLGADVSIAAGPVGGGTKAATADILAYSKSKGAFGGFTVEGALMQTKDGWNNSYYETQTTPREILLSETVTNPYADELKKIITEIAAPTTKKAEY